MQPVVPWMAASSGGPAGDSPRRRATSPSLVWASPSPRKALDRPTCSSSSSCSGTPATSLSVPGALAGHSTSVLSMTVTPLKERSPSTDTFTPTLARGSSKTGTSYQPLVSAAASAAAASAVGNAGSGLRQRSPTTSVGTAATASAAVGQSPSRLSSGPSWQSSSAGVPDAWRGLVARSPSPQATPAATQVQRLPLQIVRRLSPVGGVASGLSTAVERRPSDLSPSRMLESQGSQRSLGFVRAPVLPTTLRSSQATTAAARVASPRPAAAVGSGMTTAQASSGSYASGGQLQQPVMAVSHMYQSGVQLPLFSSQPVLSARGQLSPGRCLSSPQHALNPVAVATTSPRCRREASSPRLAVQLSPMPSLAAPGFAFGSFLPPAPLTERRASPARTMTVTPRVADSMPVTARSAGPMEAMSLQRQQDLLQVESLLETVQAALQGARDIVDATTEFQQSGGASQSSATQETVAPSEPGPPLQLSQSRSHSRRSSLADGSCTVMPPSSTKLRGRQSPGGRSTFSSDQGSCPPRWRSFTVAQGTTSTLAAAATGACAGGGAVASDMPLLSARGQAMPRGFTLQESEKDDQLLGSNVTQLPMSELASLQEGAQQINDPEFNKRLGRIQTKLLELTEEVYEVQNVAKAYRETGQRFPEGDASACKQSSTSSTRGSHSTEGLHTPSRTPRIVERTEPLTVASDVTPSASSSQPETTAELAGAGDRRCSLPEALDCGVPAAVSPGSGALRVTIRQQNNSNPGSSSLQSKFSPVPEEEETMPRWGCDASLVVEPSSPKAIHWQQQQQHQDQEEAKECSERAAVPGDVVMSRGRQQVMAHTANSGDDAWRLKDGERGVVVEVDKDGDFRLLNPSGEESGWLYCKHFVYAPASAASSGLVNAPAA
eukprot:TRINITY_DN26562_c0_g2_i1.p1 TRINITY_DN26562_c0_g2~~TRINITY_DN26562_c0_g2_i1.p1  ORF type:complete len:892 (-),score=159.66 TRINITY_DN26562_c0_g2_i1:285-2960(-)